jgi:predicted ATPase
MGGIGKTRLAIQVGHDQIGVFPDGVCFVTLAGLESISGLVPLILEAFDLPVNPQGGKLQDQLVSFLRTKHLLLILDNFDAFTEDAAILDRLHAQAPGVKFLVTSRSRLQITGEWSFDVQGLEFLTSLPGGLDELPQSDAVELFVQSAQRTCKDFQLDEENFGAILTIARLLEGFPLGLVLAASWVRILSPKEISIEILQNLDILATDLQDIPARQRNMRSVLAYSWERLNRDAQSALARLSIFRGGFTRQAAVRVADIALSDLKKFM